MIALSIFLRALETLVVFPFVVVGAILSTPFLMLYLMTCVICDIWGIEE